MDTRHTLQISSLRTMMNICYQQEVTIHGGFLLHTCTVIKKYDYYLCLIITVCLYGKLSEPYQRFGQRLFKLETTLQKTD